MAAGKYGHRLHFWDWQKHELTQSIDLGQEGLIPWRFASTTIRTAHMAFVGAALSSTMWHCHKVNGVWQADNVIAVPSVELEDGPFPCRG